MDILQLLEVLRPSGHIITVKVDNDESISKIIVGVVIAISPLLIAVVSLLFSSRQFKTSLTQQMENFEKGYKQQAKVAQLTARLATEAEIKKEWCRHVRNICIEMIAYAIDGYHMQKKLATESNRPTNPEFLEKYLEEELKSKKDIHKRFSDTFDKMSERTILLNTYLDDGDSDFFNSIQSLTIACLKGEDSPEKIGQLSSICTQQCKIYIDKKMKEISEIPLSIAD